MKNSYLPYIYVVITFLIVRFVVGFDGLYGQDSYEYLRYSKRMHEFMIGGEHPGSYFWSIGFPLVVGFLSVFSFSILSVVHIINLLSFFGIVFFAKKIIEEVYNKDYKILPIYLLITLTSPYLIQSSMVVMTDILTTFCLTGAFFFGLKYINRSSNKHLIGFTFLSCYAVFVRYVAVVPLLLIGIYVIKSWAKSRQWKQVLILIIPLILVAFHFYFKQESIESIISHEWLTSWNLGNMFTSNFDTGTGSFDYLLPNIFYAFSPTLHIGFLGIGFVLIFFYLKENLTIKIDKNNLLILLSILIYGLFLAGIPYQNKRFLLLTFPLIVIFLYPAFLSLVGVLEGLKYYKKHFAKYAISGLLIINIFITVYVMSSIVKRNKLEKKIVSAVIQFEGRKLYAMGMDISLKGRGCQFEYLGLWKKEYEFFDVGSIVIFNEQRFAEQWKGMTPMINWNKLKKEHELIIIDSFEEGWNLYEIK